MHEARVETGSAEQGLRHEVRSGERRVRAEMSEHYVRLREEIAGLREEARRTNAETLALRQAIARVGGAAVLAALALAIAALLAALL